MARLYSNENFPLPVVEALRALGHDVLTIQETGQASIGQTDPELLTFASAENRAVVTFNRRDFMRLHRADSVHAGIIACTVDENFVALAERIHDAIHQAVDLKSQLIRVYRPEAKRS